MSACKGVGFFSKKSSAAPTDPHNKQQRVNLNDIEIQQTGLISTTNNDCILRSKTITNREDVKVSKPKTTPKSEWRLSVKNFKRLSLKIDHKTDIETPKTAESLVYDVEPIQISVKSLARQLDLSKQFPSSNV